MIRVMNESRDANLLSVDASYEYISLKGLPNDTIRLLELQPGDCSAELQGRLVTVRLDDCHKYRALSYTWEDETNSQHIWLGGRRLSIRENLWKFLRRLRQDGETGYLWADAICINQQDVPERSYQVRLMSKIYSEAQQVFVWLGDDMPGDELSDREQSVLLTEEAWPILSSNIDLSLIIPIWRTVSEIASQQYWSRTWIVQEVVLAEDLVLFYKSKGRFPWDIFVEWCYSLEDLSSEASLDATEFTRQSILGWAQSLKETHPQAMASLRLMRDQYRQRNNPALSPSNKPKGDYLKNWSIIAHTLKDLVVEFAHSVCSDPRDKVYALIGLATDQPISADYAKPRAALFWDMVCVEMADERLGHRLVDVFQLTLREVRTLIMCVAATPQLRRKADCLSDWLLLSKGVYETTYDEELMDWFHWSGSEHIQLVEVVKHKESEMMRIFGSRSDVEADKLSHLLIMSFVTAVRFYLQQTDTSLSDSSQHPEQQRTTKAVEKRQSESPNHETSKKKT